MYETKTEDILEAKNGNEEIMSKLVENNAGLIWSIVKRFSGRGYELEDLYQIGCLGFIKSIKRFDETYNVKLSTYAVPYILGEIKRFIRDDGPVKVSRSIKELSYKIKLIQNEYITKKGRDIQIEELAKLLKVSKEDIVIAMDSNNTVESIDRKVNDSDDLTIMDKLKSNVDQEKDIVNKITIKTLIEGLDEKSKKIIMLRYYRGKTQSQVAELLGVTQVQVSRLEKKILSSMKHKLCSTG